MKKKKRKEISPGYVRLRQVNWSPFRTSVCVCVCVIDEAFWLVSLNRRSRGTLNLGYSNCGDRADCTRVQRGEKSQVHRRHVITCGRVVCTCETHVVCTGRQTGEDGNDLFATKFPAASTKRNFLALLYRPSMPRLRVSFHERRFQNILVKYTRQLSIGICSWCIKRPIFKDLWFSEWQKGSMIQRMAKRAFTVENVQIRELYT